VEITETQKNNITYWIDILTKESNKSTKQVEDQEDKEKQQALTIVYNAIAVDLVGSYWDKARRDLNPNRKTT